MGLTLQNDYPLAPPIGYNGQLIGAIRDCEIRTAKNVEVSASIGFGRAVVFKRVSPASDFDVLLPAAQTDLVAGIVVRQDQYGRVFSTTDLAGAALSIGELDSVGLRPGTLFTILRRGKILVVCEDGCAVGDRLFVRAVAAGDPEFLGGLNNAADATDMIDCTTQGQWLSSTGPGGLAELWVDFINK